MREFKNLFLKEWSDKKEFQTKVQNKEEVKAIGHRDSLSNLFQCRFNLEYNFKLFPIDRHALND